MALIYCGSRLGSADKQWIGVEDESITDVDKTIDGILSIGLDGDIQSDRYVQAKLQFRRPGIEWTDVGAATEISYNAVTVLVDNAEVSPGEDWGVYSDQAYPKSKAIANEGDNLAPNDGTWDSGKMKVDKEKMGCFQWGLDLSNALDGTEYEFRMIQVQGDGGGPWTALATLTILAPPVQGRSFGYIFGSILLTFYLNILKILSLFMKSPNLKIIK